MHDVPYGFCHCGCGERTTISSYSHAAMGYVKGEPRRYRPGHGQRRRFKKLRYIVKDCGFATPCWVWQLATLPNGYGMDSGRQQGAHRVEWERVHGPIPAGAHIDHLCRNRACVNPAHMECVTCAENARRGLNAKLTYADLDTIKMLRVSGMTQEKVAQRFGVARQTIGDIEQGRTWSARGGVV